MALAGIEDDPPRLDDRSDVGDLGDVGERIPIHDDDVRALARLQRADFVPEVQECGGVSGQDRNHLLRSHHLRKRERFAENRLRIGPGPLLVRAERERDAGVEEHAGVGHRLGTVAILGGRKRAAHHGALDSLGVHEAVVKRDRGGDGDARRREHRLGCRGIGLIPPRDMHEAVNPESGGPDHAGEERAMHVEGHVSRLGLLGHGKDHFVADDGEMGSGLMDRLDDVDTGIRQPRHAFPREAVVDTDGSVALIRRVPVWSGQRAGSGNEPRELRGYVTLALRDTRLPIMLGRLQMTQLGVICLVCLAMAPLIVLAVSRWLAPLHDLLTAIIKLSAGSRPEPLPESGSDDELGLLARSFNTMASQLLDARHQLEQANRELEDKVRLRTKELEHANDRLQTEIDDKNEFLRAVSHDLGAPLRNISGMAGMLLMKYRADLADDALNKLERISANAKLQTELIGDLLELSKIRTRPGRKEEVDLNELVRDIVASLTYDLERSGIELTVSGDLPVIQAERNRMRQVFQNLLDNAVKYMLDAPTRRIEVTAETTDDVYRFTIADTGKGIAAEDLPGIFHVFSRATHSGTHAVAGRGVGLASVKSIVETYGGHITAQSTLGQGSTFIFTLARSCVDEMALSG